MPRIPAASLIRAAAALAAAACARGDAARPDAPDAPGATPAAGPPAAPAGDWRVAGGDPGNGRYSALAQIDRGNVAQLRAAWIYRTGDAPAGGRSEIQATPLVVDGVLYTTTPALAAVALRADRGTPLWRFDPFAGRRRGALDTHVNRGVAYWAEGGERRVFFSAGRRLYALDAATGRPAAGFGDSGWVDLAEGLGRPVDSTSAAGGYVIATSPGAVYGDLLIQGVRVSEAEGAAPGASAGPSTPCRAPASSGTARGRPTRGRPRAAPTRGPA